MRPLALCVLVSLIGGCSSMTAEPPATRTEEPMSQTPKPATETPKGDAPMRLGNFSVSLAVKDIAASRAFYEKLGMRVIMGEAKQGWLILQNETATIGLFQGLFERNTMTFNPGWDRKGAALAEFDDVRAIQKKLEAAGLKLTMRADEKTTGPASLMLVDPDGNPILLDQHVPSPKK
jgi:catechol 2,3-dioxygenase-like lactoylglutathione lyase family enzyme